MNRENLSLSPANFVPPRGLYAIADRDAAQARGLDWMSCALAMLRADVPWLQLRAKGLEAGQMVDTLRAVKAARGEEKTLLIQNDRADVADLVQADGVHVGQDDLSVTELRRVYPQLRFGLSTHTMEQLKVALAEDAANPGRLSYLAFGPVFQTDSKKNPEPDVGLNALADAYQHCLVADIPLVAIGGIGLPEIEQVAPYAHFIAAISLLLPPFETPDPYGWIEQRCRDVHRRILAVPFSV